MAHVTWTEPALADVDRIHSYIAEHSRTSAAATARQLYTAARRLEAFPDIGRRMSQSRRAHYRELVVGRYRIIYRHDASADIVYVLRVAHGSQEIDRLELP